MSKSTFQLDFLYVVTNGKLSKYSSPLEEINYVENGVNTEVFRKNIDVDFIARMYFNGMTGIKDDSIFPGNQFTMEYLMESYLEYHLRAIVTDKGLTILNKFIKKNHQ